MVRLVVEILFSTHLYTFGGEVFLQKDGGPIGLRGTCAIAMNIMQRQFGPKTPRGEPRESHREISLGDHENSHGEILLVTMRYLTVRYLMVTKRYK